MRRERQLSAHPRVRVAFVAGGRHQGCDEPVGSRQCRKKCLTGPTTRPIAMHHLIPSLWKPGVCWLSGRKIEERKMLMVSDSSENRIYEALVALLHHHKDNGSVVFIEELQSRKFRPVRPRVVSGNGRASCNSQQEGSGSRIASSLRNSARSICSNTMPQTQKQATSAMVQLFNHDFGQDAHAAAIAAASFFRNVYLFPPDVELSIEER